MSEVGGKISSRAIFKDLVHKAFHAIDRPLEGHKNTVNTTNIWHLREQFLDHLVKEEGKVVAAAAEKAIKQSITCYAATLHFNKGQKSPSLNISGTKGMLLFSNPSNGMKENVRPWRGCQIYLARVIPRHRGRIACLAWFLCRIWVMLYPARSILNS